MNIALKPDNQHKPRMRQVRGDAGLLWKCTGSDGFSVYRVTAANAYRAWLMVERLRP